MWYQGNFPFHSLSTCLLHHSKVPIYIIIIINLLLILIIYHQYAKNSLYLCCMLYLKPHYLTGFASLSPTPILHPQYSPEGGGKPQAIRKKCGLYWRFWTEDLRRNLYIWSIMDSKTLRNKVVRFIYYCSGHFERWGYIF